MRRILFNLAAAVSLLLFLAVCGVWVRTYSHGWGGATWIRPDDGIQARWVDSRVARGEIEIMFCHSKHHAGPPTTDTVWTIGWYGISWMRFYQGSEGHDKLHFYDSHLACLFCCPPRGCGCGYAAGGNCRAIACSAATTFAPAPTDAPNAGREFRPRRLWLAIGGPLRSIMDNVGSGIRVKRTAHPSLPLSD